MSQFTRRVTLGLWPFNALTSREAKRAGKFVSLKNETENTVSCCDSIEIIRLGDPL